MAEQIKQENSLRTRPSSRLGRGLAFIAGCAVDVALMSAGFFFSFSIFYFLFPINVILFAIIAAVSIMRRNPNLRRKLFVRIPFFIFLFFTFDVMLLMHTAIYGWNPALVLIAPASFAIALYLCLARVGRGGPVKYLINFPKRLGWDAWQCLIVPLAITFVISAKSDAPESGAVCDTISAQPGVRLALDLRRFHGHKVRDMLFVENPPTLLLTYRMAFMSDLSKNINAIWEGPPGAPVKGVMSIEAVDPATNRGSMWLQQGEAIGIAQIPPRTGDIYAVVVSRVEKPAEQISHCDLVRFDTTGKLLGRVPIPHGTQVSYSANIIPRGEDVLVIVEGSFYIYSPQTNRLKTVSLDIEVPPFRIARSGQFIYGVNAHSPVFIAFTPDALIKFDVDTFKIAGKRYGGILGYYDIQKVPGADRFLLSNLWVGGGVVVDSNLNKTGESPLPRGTREFLIDHGGRYVFAPNFFSGEMRIVDLRTNRPIPGEWFVGKGTRSMSFSQKGSILIGNSCGIVEAAPTVLLNGK